MEDRGSKIAAIFDLPFSILKSGGVMTTRRDFIKTSVGAGLMLPVINRQAMGTTIVQQYAEDLAGNGNILVIVELAGGCDPLNTIVPLQQYDTYASLRSRIAIPKEQVVPFYGTTTMGMAPQLAALKPVVDAGKMAVIQMVHYPNPNLSHDGSRTIYYLGDPGAAIALSRVGWIGRHSALYGNKNNPLDTVGIGGVSPTLYAPGAKVAGINADAQGNAQLYTFQTDTRYTGDRNNQLAAARVMNTATSGKPYDDLVETTQLDALSSADQVATATAAYQSNISYPANDSFANGLKLIAKLATATATLGTRVFYCSIGGFDTHADQVTDLPTLLARVAGGLKAFYDDMGAHNLGDKTLILVWSEFGRRVADNASDGTDHGQATNMYVIGNRVKGGVYGADPALTNLQNGNLRANLDFRQVYATLIDQWIGGEHAPVLGGTFQTLGFLT
jgi:uncharacterized protein (DUF1501 family)